MNNMQEEIKEIIGLNCEEEIEVKYFAKDDSLAYKTMDYSELLDYITNLQEEISRLNNIIENIEKYIRYWNIKGISQNTMLILNDILLIKNGMSDKVVRLKEK